MVLPGRASQGPCRSGTTPRCAGRKMWIEKASMLPSACGMPAMPMKLSVLMSASEAFTSAETRASSATLTLSMAPSRVLSDSMAPSAFSIWPRMRPGCCAMAVPAAYKHQTPNAAAPSARRGQFAMHGVLPICRRGRAAPSGREPLAALLIPAGGRGFGGRRAFPEPPALRPRRCADRSASTKARNSGVTSGRTPNHSSNPRTAWCSSMPRPSAVRSPRARAAASSRSPAGHRPGPQPPARPGSAN